MPLKHFMYNGFQKFMDSGKPGPCWQVRSLESHCFLHPNSLMFYLKRPIIHDQIL